MSQIEMRDGGSRSSSTKRPKGTPPPAWAVGEARGESGERRTLMFRLHLDEVEFAANQIWAPPAGCQLLLCRLVAQLATVAGNLDGSWGAFLAAKECGRVANLQLSRALGLIRLVCKQSARDAGGLQARAHLQFDAANQAPDLAAVAGHFGELMDLRREQGGQAPSSSPRHVERAGGDRPAHPLLLVVIGDGGATRQSFNGPRRRVLRRSGRFGRGEEFD